MEFVSAYSAKIRRPAAEPGPTRTKQSFKDECNINFILRNYQKTGVMAHQAKHEGEYGEFAAIDFHEAMNTVKAAEEMFASVPSSVRTRFNNDPGEFLAFVTNKDNLVEMYDLGLAVRPPAPPPAVVPAPTAKEDALEPPAGEPPPG